MSIKDQFNRDGYYLAKSVFTPQEVAQLEDAFDKIVAQLLASGEDNNATWKGPEMDRLGAQNTVVLHTHNVQQFSSTWSQALFHPKFLEVSQAILGPDIILHHSKLFQKPAENGAPFPMHQDWGYFPTKNDTMMAGIIHVSPATDEMGCLRVYPGSHKRGRLGDSTGQGLDFAQEFPIENATILEAGPGDVLFFNYMTVHGSMPNTSNQTRKTVLVQLHSGTDELENDLHPYEGLTLSGWNHAMTRETANR